jgi:YidC/Oxa1 family membrane protein insertase
MFVINSKNQLAYEGTQKRINDSLAKLKKPIQHNNNLPGETASIDTAIQKITTTGFQLATAAESLTTLENDVIKISFSNKGGQPKSVELKKFKKADGKPVVLNQSAYNKISYRVNIADNKATEIENILFKAKPIIKNADESETLRFEAVDSLGKK